MKKQRHIQMKASAGYYSEDGFWKKLLRYAKIMGRDLCVLALTLYFAMTDPLTPAWARAVILAALGYLIIPADMVPDVIPIVGYTDDTGALGAAIATVGVHVTDEHREKARRVFDGWSGGD